MMWIGLVVGAVVGGLVWGKEGAVTLGFIGWLAGVIVKSTQKAAPTAKPGSDPGHSGVRPGSDPGSSTANWPIEDRVARLEAVVARLEARLGAGVVPEAAPAAAEVIPDAARIVVPDAAPAAMVRDPIGSPTIAAEAASGMTREPPPSEPPPPPSPPRPPNPIVAWFSGVNAIARVGLVILFFGLAFLLKYAAEAQMLPPELRVGGVA